MAETNRLGGVYDSRYGSAAYGGAVALLLLSLAHYEPAFIKQFRSCPSHFAKNRALLLAWLRRFNLVPIVDRAHPIGLRFAYEVARVASKCRAQPNASLVDVFEDVRKDYGAKIEHEIANRYESRQRALARESLEAALASVGGGTTKHRLTKAEERRFRGVLDDLAKPLDPNTHEALESEVTTIGRRLDFTVRKQWCYPMRPDRTFPLAPVRFELGTDLTRDAARRRFEEHIDAMLYMANDLELRSLSHKNEPAHLDWFVRYQVLGQSVPKIMADKPYREHPRAKPEHPSTIRHGIAGIGKLLGLEVRKGKKGRPRTRG